jgi:hypothetical protein
MDEINSQKAGQAKDYNVQRINPKSSQINEVIFEEGL